MKITMKASRVNAGLSQKQMAERLGVALSTVSSWENGKTFPRLDQFCRFCEICGVSTEDIFFNQKDAFNA